MKNSSCDLRTRVSANPKLAALLANISHRLAPPPVKGPWRTNQDPQVPVAITLEEAKFIVSERDDEALRMMITNPRIQIAKWPNGATRLFWWRACQVALPEGAIWSLLLDDYARVNGWPDPKQIEELNAKEVMYETRRPKQIMEALEPWARDINEEEFLKIVLNHKSRLANLVARNTRKPGALGVQGMTWEILREFVKDNPSVPEVKDLIWGRVIEALKLRYTDSRNSYRMGAESHADQQREFAKIAKQMLGRNLLPNDEIKEQMWDWALTREASSFLNQIETAGSGKIWVERLAREILLHPNTGIKGRELDALWAAGPSWPVAILMAWHPELKVKTAERLAANIKEVGWRTTNRFIQDDTGNGFLSGLSARDMFKQSEALTSMAIELAVGVEMGPVLRSLPMDKKEGAVKLWLVKDPSTTLKWLSKTSESDLTGLTPKVLMEALTHRDKDIRILAAATLAVFKAPEKTKVIESADPQVGSRAKPSEPVLNEPVVTRGMRR